MQLTHGLKAPGFNLYTYQVKNRFQNMPFKYNLFRYIEVVHRTLIAFMVGPGASF